MGTLSLLAIPTAGASTSPDQSVLDLANQNNQGAALLTRDGKLVFRPDSGDRVKIVVGDLEAPEESPECKSAVECLWDIFEGTTNNLGYRTLGSHVGLIYGDSISLERAEQIMAGFKRKCFASDNIVFGIGSYTYQHVARDTFDTAIKATHAIVNGRNHELFKDP